MFKKVKTIAILIIVAMALIVTKPQTIRAGALEVSNVTFYSMFGGSIIDIRSLNSRLENKGYSKFSDNLLTLGGGGYGIFKRVIICVEGHGLFGRGKTNGSHKNSLSIGYGFLNLGYLFYLTDCLNVYPLIGFGGGGIHLNIVERGNLSFDEVLDNPNRNAKLTTGVFLLNVAIGTDYLLMRKERKDKNGKVGLVLGLRVGYTFSPVKSDWEMKGVNISDGPEIGITGPYIRFMIGSGWWVNDDLLNCCRFT